MSTNTFANVYKLVVILPDDEVAREVSDSMFRSYSKNLQNSMFDTVENALVVFCTGGLLRKLNGKLW